MYTNIPKNTYEDGPNGPVIHKANIITPLVTDSNEYQLEEKSRLERNQMVGLWATKPGALVKGNLRQLNTPVWESAYLTIVVEQTQVLEKIPFEHIRKANENGLPYMISLPGRVNLSESKITVADSANIPANVVIEFQADFVKTRR